jgi:hypothetical protein
MLVHQVGLDPRTLAQSSISAQSGDGSVHYDKQRLAVVWYYEIPTNTTTVYYAHFNEISQQAFIGFCPAINLRLKFR